jgi:hypothetical protein
MRNPPREEGRMAEGPKITYLNTYLHRYMLVTKVVRVAEADDEPRPVGFP